MAELLICIERKDFPAEIPHPFYLTGFTPVVLCGPAETLQSRRIAILNSRQSPRLSNLDAWVEKTLEALHDLDPREIVLVSSLGMTAWDFLSWAGGKAGYPVILIFPAGSAQNFNILRTKAIMDLGLDERKTLAIRPLGLGPVRKKTQANALRDLWVLALSQMILPISIRPGGNLEKYLRSRQLQAKSILNKFKVGYESPKPIRKPTVPAAIQLPQWYKVDEYLIHWIRRCIGPWPDQTAAEHFEVTLAGDDAVDSGLDTLMRILQAGSIRASGRLIRGGYEVVPFTENPPQVLRDLIRWRTGLRRWTFEPYGIAIRKAKLMELGAKPVVYGEIADYERLSESDRSHFQLAHSGQQDWTREKEWRFKGDISLGQFESGDVVLFVHDIHKALLLPKTCPFQVISLKGRR